MPLTRTFPFDQRGRLRYALTVRNITECRGSAHLPLSGEGDRDAVVVVGARLGKVSANFLFTNIFLCDIIQLSHEIEYGKIKGLLYFW